MEGIELFAAAIGLKAPWSIQEIQLERADKEKGELHIFIGHSKRTKFEYEGEKYSVYDHQDRSWRHLNFFEHECYIHASVPRVKTAKGVKLVEVPWAQPGSSFTVLFEHHALNLVHEGMSAASTGRTLGISGRRVFHILNRVVSIALANTELDQVKEMSLDEVSSRKGHKYLTILTDRKAKKVIGIAEGKNELSVANALIDMEVRGSERKKVKNITMDMSKSYIRASRNYLPQAAIIFDRFHISKLLNEAVDQVRREEQLEYSELRKTRYLWLRNNNNLSKKNQEKVFDLSDSFPRIGQAYRCKELFRAIMNNAYKSHLLRPLKEWMKMAESTGIEPIVKFVKMLKRHWYGVKTYFKHLATNALAERMNLKIQEIKRTAKGYRNINNFILMIYFHLGGLNLNTHYK